MHLAKYKRSSVVSLIAHDERTVENHTNEKIDPSKSHLNYSLIERGFDYYQKRLSEVFCINRKDVNTIGSLVITLPKEVKEADQEMFFQKAFEYFSDKFGEKNIVSAEVHRDETTDHLHLKFIPVYLQEKIIKRGKDKGKTIKREAVSFDEVCPRSFFRSLHKDFQEYIDEELEYHVGVLNGETKGFETVEAMKEAQKLKENNGKLKDEIDSLAKEKQELEEKNNQLIQEKEQLVSRIKQQDEVIVKQEKLIQKNDERIQKQKVDIDHNIGVLENQRKSHEYNNKRIREQYKKYQELKQKVQELIDVIKPLERLKGVLQAIRTFSYDFRQKINEIEYRCKLNDNDKKCLDDFWRATDEQDIAFDEAIDVAMKMADDPTYNYDDLDDFEMEL